jgi:hypothetical protein
LTNDNVANVEQVNIGKVMEDMARETRMKDTIRNLEAQKRRLAESLPHAAAQRQMNTLGKKIARLYLEKQRMPRNYQW